MEIQILPTNQFAAVKALATVSAIHYETAMVAVGADMDLEIRMEVLGILFLTPAKSLKKEMVRKIFEQFLSRKREYFELDTLDNALRIAKALDYKLPAPGLMRHWAKSFGYTSMMKALELNPDPEVFHINGAVEGLRATVKFLIAVRMKMPAEASQPQAVTKVAVAVKETKVAEVPAPKAKVKAPAPKAKTPAPKTKVVAPKVVAKTPVPKAPKAQPQSQTKAVAPAQPKSQIEKFQERLAKQQQQPKGTGSN